MTHRHTLRVTLRLPDVTGTPAPLPAAAGYHFVHAINGFTSGRHPGAATPERQQPQ